MTEKEYYDQVDAEYSYVNELLNQLDRAYYDGYADGYKYAVDDFFEKVCQRAYTKNNFFVISPGNLVEIAEELKTVRGSE